MLGGSSEPVAGSVVQLGGVSFGMVGGVPSLGEVGGSSFRGVGGGGWFGGAGRISEEDCISLVYTCAKGLRGDHVVGRSLPLEDVGIGWSFASRISGTSTAGFG